MKNKEEVKIIHNGLEWRLVTFLDGVMIKNVKF